MTDTVLTYYLFWKKNRIEKFNFLMNWKHEYYWKKYHYLSCCFSVNLRKKKASKDERQVRNNVNLRVSFKKMKNATLNDMHFL